MAAISSSELEKRLSQAVANYHQWWQPVDEVLYRLCEQKPSQDDETVAYSKVAVIGRVYGAQVVRSFKAPKGKDKELIVARGLVDQAEVITEGLNDLGGQFDRQVAAAIVELHTRITSKLTDSTNGVWLTSFVSKYLHFHCPLVPIYDSRAASSVSKFVGRKTAAGVRTSMGTEDLSTAYRRFVSAFVALHERVWNETSLQPSVKEIDHLLLRS